MSKPIKDSDAMSSRQAIFNVLSSMEDRLRGLRIDLDAMSSVAEMMQEDIDGHSIAWWHDKYLEAEYALNHLAPGTLVLLDHYFAENQVWSGRASVRYAKHQLGYPEWIYDILLIDSKHYLFDVPSNMLTELTE